jgi:hypothetical protein
VSRSLLMRRSPSEAGALARVTSAAITAVLTTTMSIGRRYDEAWQSAWAQPRPERPEHIITVNPNVDTSPIRRAIEAPRAIELYRVRIV